MKIIVLTFFAAILFAGCKKAGVSPVDSTQTTAVSDSTQKAAADNQLHQPVFSVASQLIKTSVSNQTLTLVFNENVTITLTAAGYNQTSAIHLSEDFYNTMLSSFDYTTVNENGQVTPDWVDDNLNNVTSKTVTYTVVNNINMVNITVNRQFTFFRTYASNQTAVNEQNIFLSDTGDQITFTSYCYYNQKNYPLYSVNAKVVYTK
jgi:hypothetical protein